MERSTDIRKFDFVSSVSCISNGTCVLMCVDFNVFMYMYVCVCVCVSMCA